MRYAKNETQGMVNGVIFYFEAGDEPIAADVMELVAASEKPPTSIVWSEECLTSAEESLRLQILRLQISGLAEDEWLGIRLTIDDLPLLKKVLELFKEDYPPLSRMVTEIEGQLLVTRH